MVQIVQVVCLLVTQQCQHASDASVEYHQILFATISGQLEQISPNRLIRQCSE